MIGTEKVPSGDTVAAPSGAPDGLFQRICTEAFGTKLRPVTWACAPEGPEDGVTAMLAWSVHAHASAAPVRHAARRASPAEKLRRRVELNVPPRNECRRSIQT